MHGRDGAGTKEGYYTLSRNEGKTVTSDHTRNELFHRYQLLDPLHGGDFSTTPLPHTTYLSAGGVVEICRLCYMMCWLPLNRLIVHSRSLRLLLDFLRNTTQHAITRATQARLNTRTA